MRLGEDSKLWRQPILEFIGRVTRGHCSLIENKLNRHTDAIKRQVLKVFNAHLRNLNFAGGFLRRLFALVCLPLAWPRRNSAIVCLGSNLQRGTMFTWLSWTYTLCGRLVVESIMTLLQLPRVHA